MDILTFAWGRNGMAVAAEGEMATGSDSEDWGDFAKEFPLPLSTKEEA
jgi:hypothetical protein